MVITLQLNTGAYCSSRKLDITISKRPPFPLRSFFRRSFHPFNLALSSLPLLFSSLSLLFLRPPQASYPSSPATLPIDSHSLPFPPIYQQMQMFIILANTFDNSCEQLKGLQERRMKLHLAIGGSIMTYFSLFPAGEKLTCFTLFLSFFNQKR